MKRDIILVFFGGTMDGVFGAGVVTALQKANIYQRIHSIYSASCGAHNAAYFLAESTALGSSIYYEDLIGKNFIKDNKLIFLRKLSSHFIYSRKRVPKMIDMDYLMEIEKNRKKLDINKISKSKINFYIKAFDIKKMQEEYLPGKSSIFKKLQASSAVMPFYPKVVSINGRQYADGQVLSRIIDSSLGKALDKTDKKIIFIFNMPIRTYVSLRYHIANALWALLLALEIKDVRVFKKLNILSEYFKLMKYLKKSNVCVIDSDIEISPFCTDKKRLLELYNHGINKTKEFLKKNRQFLKH
jgi:predicted patatin/cPLA2 family phospholipase